MSRLCRVNRSVSITPGVFFRFSPTSWGTKENRSSMPRPVKRLLVRSHGNVFRAQGCPMGRERYIIDDLFELPFVLSISVYNRPAPFRVYGSRFTGRRWYRMSRGYIADHTPYVCPWVGSK